MRAGRVSVKNQGDTLFKRFTDDKQLGDERESILAKAKYQVHYEPGDIDGDAGATQLMGFIAALCVDGSEVVSVVPVTKDGTTVGVQVVIKRPSYRPSLS